MLENFIGPNRELIWVLKFWPVLVSSFIAALIATALSLLVLATVTATVGYVQTKAALQGAEAEREVGVGPRGRAAGCVSLQCVPLG